MESLSSSAEKQSIGREGNRGTAAFTLWGLSRIRVRRQKQDLLQKQPAQEVLSV